MGVEWGKHSGSHLQSQAFRQEDYSEFKTSLGYSEDLFEKQKEQTPIDEIISWNKLYREEDKAISTKIIHAPFPPCSCISNAILLTCICKRQYVAVCIARL